MALTTAEKQRALTHLGFAGGVTDYTVAAGPLIGTLEVRTNAEAQLERVNATGEARVRQILTVMDDLETKLVRAQCRLAAAKVGSIAMNEGEPLDLEAEVRRWGWRLAEAIGCEPNPFSQRYRGAGINVARA